MLSPIAVLAEGARVSWIVAGLGTALLLVGLATMASRTARAEILNGAAATAGVTLALLLLPEPATSLGLAVGVGAIGAALVVVGAVTQRADPAVLAAGGLWVGWVTGLMLRTGHDIDGRTQVQVATVLGVAAVVLVSFSVLGGRREYAWVGAAFALAGVAAAVLAADVRGVEWYSLPAAAVLLIAGLAWRHTSCDLSS
jgi:hypothetical protein